MNKIEMLRAKMAELQVDAFLILSAENRRYLTGFKGSNGIVLLTAQKGVLITDSRYVEQAEKEAPDFTIVRYNLSSFATVKEYLQTLGCRKVAYESKRIDDYTIGQIRKLDETVEFVPTTDVLLHMRRIKDKTELSALRKAIEIADLGLLDLTKTAKAGMTEKEFAYELEYCMKKHGSENPSFDTIVVSGVRTSLPHGTPTDKKILGGDMVTVDFGAVYDGYHSDITRTLWFGEPSKRMQEIFDVVAKSQQAAFAAIQVGARCMDVDAAHRQVFLDAGMEEYSLRGLGHGVGLEIHEWPRVVMHNEDLLEDNMIFTVEPGIYIPDVGGVRTEDIVILENGKMEIVTKSPTKIVID